jgi:dienelactone hydrolase
VPANARAGLPVQVHLADPDEYESAEYVAGWLAAGERAGLKAEMFRYPGAGHYFLDAALPDYDRKAAVLAEARIVEFLQSL